jgi:hypothetical protein
VIAGRRAVRDLLQDLAAGAVEAARRAIGQQQGQPGAGVPGELLRGAEGAFMGVLRRQSYGTPLEPSIPPLCDIEPHIDLSHGKANARLLRLICKIDVQPQFRPKRTEAPQK